MGKVSKAREGWRERLVMDYPGLQLGLASINRRVNLILHVTYGFKIDLHSFTSHSGRPQNYFPLNTGGRFSKKARTLS